MTFGAGDTRNETATRPPISEAAWQQRVIDLARRCGWKCSHQRPAQVRPGRWATATTGDVGAPDLLLARAGVVLLVELKSDSGRFRPGQREWITECGDAGRIWRPQDWDDVKETLR